MLYVYARFATSMAKSLWTRPSLGSTSFVGQEMEKRKQAEATVQDLDLNLDTSQSEMGKCAGIPWNSFLFQGKKNLNTMIWWIDYNGINWLDHATMEGGRFGASQILQCTRWKLTNKMPRTC